MKRISILLSLVFAVYSAVFSQQPTSQPGWNITLQPNTTASSNLSVINQCRKKHNFEIQPQNVPFLNISRNQAQVNGGQTVNIPVQFNTQNLSPGLHQGQVLVICLSCRSEPTCTQDREVLQVIVNVPQPQNPPNTPVNPNTPNNQPLPNPAGNNPSANPDGQAPSTTIPKEKISRVTAVFDGFQYGPCPALQADCEKLRQIAAEKEAAAADALAKADAAGSTAGAAETKAKDAEAAAKRAGDAVTPEGPTTAVVDGEGYTQADSDHLVKLRKKNQDDYLAGRISEAEYQRRANELTTKKAQEDRLAEQARLKKEAEAAKAAADAARAEADKAKAAADADQKAADAAKAAADAALEEYKKCLKKIEDKCLRVATENKRKADEAAAAAAAAVVKKADDDRRKKEADDRARAQQDEIDYLLDNFKRLGLITHTPKTNVPDPLDAAFDALQTISGETIRNFLQSVAGQVGGGPIDPSYITALGEAYKAMGALFNMRTKAGLERVHRLLTTKIINPKTGKVYTDDEAWNKIKRMEDLMDKIKKKLAESGK